MMPFPCQIMVDLVYLVFIMLNNNVGNEPVTLIM